ncbi:MAG: autotransporter-associated beta strand repeat-containing protein [Verrucomicrobiae bacterium]|nr:autotransporter-associated beta strand repeat-containing protein [Verrucomicrobiae bacterium]
MQTIKTVKTIWLCAALMIFSLATSKATTYYSGSATGDPTLTTSWWTGTGGTGSHPADFISGDTFIIQSGHNYTIPASTTWTVNANGAGTAATVQVNSGGTLTFTLPSGSTCKLVLGGNFKLSGTIAGTTTSTTGIIEFTSNGTWTGSGDISNVKGSIQVDSGVTLDASGMSAGFKLKSSNTLGITVNGTLIMGTLTINGNGNGTASFTLGSSGTLVTATTSASGLPGIFTGFSANKITLPTTANYTFNGVAAQVTGTTANNATMPAEVNNLTITNNAGVTLSQAMQVDGTLAFTAGIVKSNITLGASATISGGSSTAYLNGQLTVPFTAPTSASFTFPVGTAGAYSPVSIANFTDSGSGSLTASATASQNPNQGTSGIDSSKYIARYWTLTNTPDSTFAGSTFNFTGTFVAGDIQGGANTSILLVQKWDGTAWVSPAGSSSTSTTVTGTGFTAFGQFAAGEPQTSPNLSSPTKSAITTTTATLGATVISAGISAVTSYGIVWSIVNNPPTVADNKVQTGTSISSYPSVFTQGVTGLPTGVTIYYRGYAQTGAGIGYSVVDSFMTLTNEPTTPASGVSGSALQNGNLTFTWTRGNGARCLVLVNAGSPVSSAPVDGTSYTANAAFGSGTPIGSGYVAYLGTGTTVTISGLSAGTTYYVAVYELNGAGGSENYLTTTPATGNQTTVSSPISLLSWTGGADNNWNNTGNWDQPVIPDVGTSVFIPITGNPPVYSSPMTPASFGPLTDADTLTVNANGFNSGALTLANTAENSASTGAKLFVGSGGVVNVSGAVLTTSNAWLTISNGGSLTASGALNIGSGSSVGSCGAITNLGGNLAVTSVGLNTGNASLSSSGASGTCLMVIRGGTNSLGSVAIARDTSSGGFTALGTEGLAIYGGQVTMSSLNAGNGNANSYLAVLIAGGVVTNNGSVLINQLSSGRGSRVLQTGGFFVVSNLVNPNPTAAGSLNIYSVSGGTNLVGGFSFGSAANAGSVFFTNAASIYVGNQGMVSNGVVLVSAVLNDGALLGASADWTGSVAMGLAIGTETIKTADLGGTPHNITYNAPLTGAGNLNVIGGGTLTLGAANTYLGSTLISSGTLALGAAGSLTSPQINLGSGTIFNVSALGGLYSPVLGQTLAGFGTVNGLVTANNGSIQPGSNSVTGTLAFSSGLAETGGVTNNFVLPGDKVACTGLTVSGANVVQITGGVSAGSEYTLFDYTGGSFSGSVANFNLVGVTGYLTNVVAQNAIKLHASVSLRAPTNVVWVGNSAANNWDTGASTNWLNGSALDDFLFGDTAVFGNQGALHPLVNIGGSVSPGSVVVNTSSGYTFTGNGSISGLGGITVSNGSLTIANTNTYTGPTVLAGGVLIISNIANGTVASPIGAASVSAVNVVFNGGTLAYLGSSASTDHGITLNSGGGGIDVPAGTTLTLNGSILGAGALTKTDAGSLTLAVANTYGGGTVVSNGTLTLSDAGAAGSGAINLYGGNLVLGAIKPANTINVAGNAQVSGGNAGGATGIRNVTGGSNLVVSVTAGVFDLTGDMSTYSGTISLTNAGGATVRLNGSASNVGSQLATWNLGAGTMDLNIRVSSTSNNIGALQGGSNTTLSGRGGSGNSGSTTYYIGANNLNSSFDGVIQNGYGSSGTVPSSSSPTSINKVGSGRLTLNGVSTYTGTTTVSGGTLSGIGTISGATTFNPDTVLEAGDAGVGTLTFSGDLNLDAASTNNFAVTSSGGASNSVVVNGGLSPNNSVIKITSGTALAAGTYTLFTYNGIGGAFNPTPVFDVAPAATATIVDDGSHIKLQIGAPAPPAIGSVDFSALVSSGQITINGVNGKPGGSVNVLSSTNLLVPLADWTTVTSGNFDGSGNYNSGAISVNPTAPQQYFILQTP